MLYTVSIPSVVVLDFTLTIKRRPGFYVTYLYIPSVVIIASSLFAFYLPPGSDAKVDLAVTGLLSQTVFLLLISDLMPPDAYNPPFLGKIFSLVMIDLIQTFMKLWIPKITINCMPTWLNPCLKGFFDIACFSPLLCLVYAKK